MSAARRISGLYARVVPLVETGPDKFVTAGGCWGHLVYTPTVSGLNWMGYRPETGGLESRRVCALGPEKPSDHRFAGREHVVDLVGLLTAGFGEIRSTAAA